MRISRPIRRKGARKGLFPCPFPDFSWGKNLLSMLIYNYRFS
ncbi:hypothetical protein B4135_3276 [Caldibacillus debilis]|uniref:Uncharacterized protein n=1 Tax=Caldibacillus debilis TaxID=301148 RepID=A0A150LFQ1_9BACI|nr:hypothetical protein B4135_3276 [Caldibacillus debilis]